MSSLEEALLAARDEEELAFGQFVRETAAELDFSEITYRRTEFRQCRFTGCDFSGASFYDCTFSECAFSACRFPEGYWKDCKLEGC